MVKDLPEGTVVFGASLFGSLAAVEALAEELFALQQDFELNEVSLAQLRPSQEQLPLWSLPLRTLLRAYHNRVPCSRADWHAVLLALGDPRDCVGAPTRGR